ncbi:MAG: hypothetical protein ACFE9Z_00465 [Promethearchaeota archaeon]
MNEISEIEHNSEKVLEERLRSTIEEEFQEKGMKLRKIAGLILSGIPAIIYLSNGLISFGSGGAYNFLSIPYLISGIIALIGTIIGVKLIKLGGTVILISIIFAFFLSLLFFNFPYHMALQLIIYLLLPHFPIPFFPFGVLLIIGGILCVISSDQ